MFGSNTLFNSFIPVIFVGFLLHSVHQYVLERGDLAGQPRHLVRQILGSGPFEQWLSRLGCCRLLLPGHCSWQQRGEEVWVWEAGGGRRGGDGMVVAPCLHSLHPVVDVLRGFTLDHGDLVKGKETAHCLLLSNHGLEPELVW